MELGYWVRPYDVLLDRRRWRWQCAGRCGRATFAALPPAERADLERAVAEYLAKREVDRTDRDRR